MLRAHEDHPATKRDLAEMSEHLVEEIQRVERDLKRVERDLKGDLRTLATKKDIDRLREILTGPDGFVERLEKLEQCVGGYR